MEEPPECFICTETIPTPRKSACLCTDRYVHDECFLKMLESQSPLAATRCYVCKADHGNLKVVARRVVQVKSLCGLVVLFLCCILILASILLSTWSAATRDGRTTFLVAASYVIMGMGISASIVAVAMLVAKNGARSLAGTCLQQAVVSRTVSAPTEVLVELGSTNA
mgnify:CR=1 FL=1